MGRTQYWLLKTEPGDYSYGDLARDGTAVWDGVSNNLALKFLREIRKGDRAFIYHSGKDRHIAGVAEVTRDPYPDPAGEDPKRVVVDIRAVEALSHPVTLSAIKADEAFSELHLVKISRLSVMPVTAVQWHKLCRMGGLR